MLEPHGETSQQYHRQQQHSEHLATVTSERRDAMMTSERRDAMMTSERRDVTEAEGTALGVRAAIQEETQSVLEREDREVRR